MNEMKKAPLRQVPVNKDDFTLNGQISVPLADSGYGLEIIYAFDIRSIGKSLQINLNITNSQRKKHGKRNH